MPRKTHHYVFAIVGIVALVGIIILIIISFQHNDKTNYFEDDTTVSVTDAESIAREHLEQYVYHAFPDGKFFTSYFLRSEVIDADECFANDYWEKWGSASSSISTQPCFEVRFYYQTKTGLEGYLIVYVDKEIGEVIGGTQTR